MLPPKMPTNTPTHRMASPKQSPRAARPQKTAPISLNQQPALQTLSSPAPSVGAASAANTGAAGAMPPPDSSPPKQTIQSHATTAIHPPPAKPKTWLHPKYTCKTDQSCAVPRQLPHVINNLPIPQTASLQPCPTRPNLIHEIRQKHLKPSMPLSSQPSHFTSFKP